MRSAAPVVVLCLALLLLSPAPPTEGSLPELTSPATDHLGPVSPPPGRAVSPHSDNRLPGVCRRLRRRRITVLCNSDKFCSSPDLQGVKVVQNPQTGPRPQSIERSVQSPPQSIERSAQSPPQSIDRSAQSPPQSIDRSVQSPPQSIDRSAQSPPQSIDRSVHSK
ncbi:unnamed protein product [Arctogadus glacialis]